jgi:hypothetical protein
MESAASNGIVGELDPFQARLPYGKVLGCGMGALPHHEKRFGLSACLT